MPRTNNIDIFKMPELTLASPQFTVNPYVPIQFDKPQSTVDSAIQSLKDINALDKENSDKFTELQMQFDNDKFNNIFDNEESRKAFDEQTKKYITEVENVANNSYTGVNSKTVNMFRTGKAITQLAKNYTGDKVINGLKKQKLEADETLKFIDSMFGNGKIDGLRRDRLKHELKTRYNPNIIRDKVTGEAIGVGEWKPNIDLIEKLDTAKFAATIQALTAPKDNTSGGTGNTLSFVSGNLKDQKEGRLGGADTYLKSETKGGHTHIKELSTKMLDKTYNALKDNGLIRQLDAELDDMLYQIQDYTERINNEGLSEAEKSSYNSRIEELNNFLYDGGPGGGHPNREKLEKKLIQLIHQGAYKNIDSISNKTIDVSAGGSGRTSTTDGGGGAIDLTQHGIGASHQKLINVPTSTFNDPNNSFYRQLNSVNQSDFENN